jgi:hypothetical protein
MSGIIVNLGGPQGRLKTAVVHSIVLAADLEYEEAAEEQDDHSPLATDPEENLDAGGSLLIDGDEAIRGPSDREGFGDLRLIHELPKSARPPVYFFIDEFFAVHPLGSTVAQPAEMRLAIARAIAHHLKSKAVVLRERGDWRHIPCIGRDADLMRLAQSQMVGERVATRSGKSMSLNVGLNKYGAEYKAFAIVLSNGDVVTPQALINPASRSKAKPSRATRAAALRALADASAVGAERPAELAGESWNEKRWNAFEKAQRQAGRKPKKNKT